MRILVASIGTRGDMEPLLAVGQLLHKRGHHITCLFPEQYRNLAEECGFDFESLGLEFLEFLDSPAGRIAMGGGKMSWKKFKAYLSLIKTQGPFNQKMFRIQREVIKRLQPDRIIHNGKVIYPIIWSTQNTHKAILNLPIPFMHYVKGHTHIAFHSNYGTLLNKLTYWIAEFGLTRMIKSTAKKDAEQLKLKNSTIKKALRSNKSYYSISPTLMCRPNYWTPNIQVLGYREKTLDQEWSPSLELQQFFMKHSKVLLVTFGSMINDSPELKTNIILSILEEYNLPAVINTAAGGLVKPEAYNSELFFFIKSIPYGWVLPKVHGVIHHGGSGTTHMVLKYGKPSLIIPHIIDQYAWNKINNQLGAGPLGMDISKITLDNLAPLVVKLWNDQNYLKCAGQLKQDMAEENYTDDLYKFIIRPISY